MIGLHICCNFALVEEDKFVKSVSIKDNNTFSPFLAIFQGQTLTFMQAYIPIPSALKLYIDVNLQKTTKLALESFI